MEFRGGGQIDPPQHILVFKYLSRNRVNEDVELLPCVDIASVAVIACVDIAALKIANASIVVPLDVFHSIPQ